MEQFLFVSICLQTLDGSVGVSCKVLNEKTEMSLKQSLKVGRILHKAIFFFFNFPFPILSSLNSVACQVVMYSSKLLLHSVPVSTVHLLKVANGVLESSHKKNRADQHQQW